MKIKIIIPSLVISSLVIGHSVWAMAGKPPAQPKEESKYKLEILKMEVITSPTPSAEATCEAHQ